MRKLLAIILFSISFTACDETVFGYTENPVIGVWNSYYPNTDSLVMTRVFSYDFKSYFVYADGKSQNRLNEQVYYIEDDRIVLAKYSQFFRIVADSLWITNQKQDQTTKYIRSVNR